MPMGNKTGDKGLPGVFLTEDHFYQIVNHLFVNEWQD